MAAEYRSGVRIIRRRKKIKIIDIQRISYVFVSKLGHFRPTIVISDEN